MSRILLGAPPGDRIQGRSKKDPSGITKATTSFNFCVATMLENLSSQAWIWSEMWIPAHQAKPNRTALSNASWGAPRKVYAPTSGPAACSPCDGLALDGISRPRGTPHATQDTALMLTDSTGSVRPREFLLEPWYGFSPRCGTITKAVQATSVQLPSKASA